MFVMLSCGYDNVPLENSKTRRQYGFVAEKARSTACTQCRECEPKCPQSIPVSEWMPRISEVLAEGKPYPR